MLSATTISPSSGQLTRSECSFVVAVIVAPQRIGVADAAPAWAARPAMAMTATRCDLRIWAPYDGARSVAPSALKVLSNVGCSPGTMQFAILGPLDVRNGATSLALGGPKQRALLAILLL